MYIILIAFLILSTTTYIGILISGGMDTGIVEEKIGNWGLMAFCFFICIPALAHAAWSWNWDCKSNNISNEIE